MGFHPEPECTPEQAAIHLWYWQHGGDSFHSHLFTMIHKADPDNLRKIYLGFPIHVTAWQLWGVMDSPEEFYDSQLPKEELKFTRKAF